MRSAYFPRIRSASATSVSVTVDHGVESSRVQPYRFSELALQYASVACGGGHLTAQLTYLGASPADARP